MFSNHQGKYDTLGIMASHPRPCTIVMDSKRSHLPLVDSFIDLVKGSRLDKTDMKSQMKTIQKIAGEVRAGRKYIVFQRADMSIIKIHCRSFIRAPLSVPSKQRHLLCPWPLLILTSPLESILWPG